MRPRVSGFQRAELVRITSGLPDKEVIFIYTVGRLPCPFAPDRKNPDIALNPDTLDHYLLQYRDLVMLLVELEVLLDDELDFERGLKLFDTVPLLIRQEFRQQPNLP